MTGSPDDLDYTEQDWLHSHANDTPLMEAEYNTTAAYRRLFNPNNPDAQIVLADLLTYSGFTRVSADDTSTNTLMFREGRRQLYSRIFSFLALSSGDIHALEIAARREAALTQI